MRSCGNDKININNVFNVKYPMPTLRGHTVSYIYLHFNQLWLSGTEYKILYFGSFCMYVFFNHNALLVLTVRKNNKKQFMNNTKIETLIK